MPPTLELVEPLCFEDDSEALPLVLAHHAFCRILRIICEARMVTSENRGHFHAQNTLVLDNFLAMPGPPWDLRVVRAWICRDFVVPLESILNVDFQVCPKK